MFNNVYRDKKVIITGHTGFKGSWLSLWLNKLGATVIGVSDNVPTDPSLFESVNLRSIVKDVRIDVRNLEDLKRLFIEEKPDFVFHLAAQSIVSTSYFNPIETLSINIMGTANVLESLRFLENNCVAIIITSDKCYDNVEWEWGYKETDHLGGKDIYSGSKGGAELVFKSYFHSFFKESTNIRIATARAGNVIGGGDWAKDRIIPDCMRAWNENKHVEIRSPQATRPWQHVLDPLSGYLDLAESLYCDRSLNGASFNFGPKSENNHTVIKLLVDLSKNWKFTTESEVFKVIGDVKFNEAELLKLNCDKAVFYLKWEPTLEYSTLIDFTSAWYYNYFKGNCDMYEFTTKQVSEYEVLAKRKGLKWTR